MLDRLWMGSVTAVGVCAVAIALGSAPGCGGHVASVGDGGDDAPTDAGHDTATQDSPPPVDCAAMSKQLDALRAEAKTCCPFCNSIQCANVVQDVCCPFSITAPVAPQFSALLAQYRESCPQACPATPCPAVPSRICKPNDPMNPNSRGTCQ